MTHYKYLIIGGGIAGTSAAETIRQNDKEGAIAIVSDEPYPLYSRIMLSKPPFYTGENKPEKTYLKQPEWYPANKIDFLGGKTAASLEPTKKTVTLQSGEVLEYEKLLLALGAYARPLPGIQPSPEKPIFYLRTLDHVKEIGKHLGAFDSVVVIGGGFIGFEICDILTLLKKKVISVNITPRYWEPILDAVSSRIVEDALKKHNIEVYAESTIKEILGTTCIDGVTIVHVPTKAEQKIPCSMIIAGVGIVCKLDWVKAAGLTVNRGIVTNEYMETSIPDIWAAGDCAEYRDVLLEEQVILGNWANAQMHGRTAAFGMTGKRTEYRKATFYTTQGLGIAIGMVGDVAPTGTDGRITIARGSYESGSYAQILVAKNEMIGGILINRNQELGMLISLIEKNVKVGDKLKELSDPNFELKTLLPA